MASLSDHSWPQVLTTSQNNLIKDFFNPALGSSKRYDRGVGFFSSGWLRASAEGMVAFANNGGRARWVTSPILDEGDWQALQTGDAAKADPVIKAVLLRNISSLEHTLEKDILSAIAWMVADEILTFKLAVPRNKLEHGDFHDKFGIFSDSEGNRISFNGSYNDSVQGLRNYESIKIFISWNPSFAPLVEADRIRFEQLWNNEDPNVEVYDVDEAGKSQIIQLRSKSRPYEIPPWMKSARRSDKQEFFIPTDLILREYQKTAIQAWLNANGRGILAMATGSGKTLTALYAAHKVSEKVGGIALIVVCPYINLAIQWASVMERFGLHPIHCYDLKANWQDRLSVEMAALLTGANKIVAIVVTNTTFQGKSFQSYLVPNQVVHLLIADEVHNLGATKIKECLNERVQYRLGLSATPERHFDEAGTKLISDYFGGVVFEFSLADAIKAKVLSPYDYFPVLVDLTEQEAEEYWKITDEISRQTSIDEDEPNPFLDILLIKRARLLASAKNKLVALRTAVASLPGPPKQTIVYCGDGRVDFRIDNELERHVTAVTRLLGEDMGLRVRRFTADESSDERERILRDLREEYLDAIVAIRCLDEGIDIPSVRMGFILASSTNPRQYIQRRGRLLRPAEGKDKATIYDFIVNPPDYGGVLEDKAFNIERRLFRRELKRVIEFCATARNGMMALNTLTPLRKKYNLLGEIN